MITATKNIVGEIIGKVMCQNWYRGEAPATSAASYKLFGTDCNAPKNNKNVNPKCIQTVVAITATIAQLGVVNHMMGLAPKLLITWFKIPIDGLNMNNQKTAETDTETPIVAVNTVRKKPIPRNFWLAMAAKSNPNTIVKTETPIT